MLEFLQSAHQRRRPAGLRRARLRRPQPLRARLRDDPATSAASAKRPTPRIAQWFPELAGTRLARTLDFAMRNFKDESFIAQYLSPRLIREFRLFAVADHEQRGDAAGRQHPRRARLPPRAQAARGAARAGDARPRRAGRPLRSRRRPLADAAARAPPRTAAAPTRRPRSSRTCAGCGASRCASRPGRTSRASATSWCARPDRCRELPVLRRPARRSAGAGRGERLRQAPPTSSPQAGAGA